jgi:hypothetical protein
MYRYRIGFVDWKDGTMVRGVYDDDRPIDATWGGRVLRELQKAGLITIEELSFAPSDTQTSMHHWFEAGFDSVLYINGVPLNVFWEFSFPFDLVADKLPDRIFPAGTPRVLWWYEVGAPVEWLAVDGYRCYPLPSGLVWMSCTDDAVRIESMPEHRVTYNVVNIYEDSATDLEGCRAHFLGHYGNERRWEARSGGVTVTGLTFPEALRFANQLLADALAS